MQLHRIQAMLVQVPHTNPNDRSAVCRFRPVPPGAPRLPSASVVPGPCCSSHMDWPSRQLHAGPLSDRSAALSCTRRALHVSQLANAQVTAV